jgi:hypothetical protein
VPAYVFCGGVDDNIRAILKRAEQIGRGKGVVNDERDSVFWASPATASISMRQELGLPGLDEERFGVFPDSRLKASRHVGVHKGDVDSEIPEGMGKQVVVPPYSGWPNDMVAGMGMFCMAYVTAAAPHGKRSAAMPPSSAAIRLSNTSQVGFMIGV